MNLHDYNADVNEVLNKRKSAGNLLRFGAEVETGWHLEGARNDFFKALSDEGLDKFAIAKFDRSITSAQCAEIVTLPLKLDELSDAMRRVGTILTKQTKDSSMQNCGVHIHVTRSAMHTDQFWRAVCAVMIKKDDWQYYQGRDTIVSASAAKKFNAHVDVINEFWTKLALRHPTKYCQRYGFHNLMNADGRANHNQAVTRGKHTPTVEYRLFKTARSPVVLASYAEAVAALVAFSDAPPQDLLDNSNIEAIEKSKRFDQAKLDFLNILAKYPNTLDQIEDLIGFRRGTLMMEGIGMWQHYGHNLAKYIVNGYSYEDGWGTREDRERTTRNNVSHYVTKAMYEELYELRENLVPPAKNTLGAVSWRDHLFPVYEFMSYIEANGNTYPNLAERLKLPKFTSMVGRGEMVLADDTNLYDTETPHDTVRYGCLVMDQSIPEEDTGGEGEGGLKRVIRRRKDGKGIVAEDYVYECHNIKKLGKSPADEVLYAHSTEILGSDILHKCPGAKLQEGHDE